MTDTPKDAVRRVVDAKGETWEYDGRLPGWTLAQVPPVHADYDIIDALCDALAAKEKPDSMTDETTTALERAVIEAAVVWEVARTSGFDDCVAPSVAWAAEIEATDALIAAIRALRALRAHREGRST